MKQANPQSLGPDDRSPTYDDVAFALQAIVSDVDVFVSDWFKRLKQAVVLPAQVPTTNQQLLKLIDNFQREKRQWEDDQTAAEEEIQKKVEEISEAWLRLEAEQRRFLQTKETYASNLPEHRAARESLENPGTSELTTSKTSDGRCLNEQPQRSPLLDTNVKRSAKDTVQQFQRLRREIESNRPGLDQR